MALKKAGGAMRPGELVPVMKLEGYAQRQLLTKLAKTKRVVRKGTGRGAIVTLPGYKPAKEDL